MLKYAGDLRLRLDCLKSLSTPWLPSCMSEEVSACGTSPTLLAGISSTYLSNVPLSGAVFGIPVVVPACARLLFEGRSGISFCFVSGLSEGSG